MMIKWCQICLSASRRQGGLVGGGEKRVNEVRDAPEN